MSKLLNFYGRVWKKEWIKDFRVSKVRIPMNVVDEKFRKNWKNYLWQSAGAGASLLLILLVFVNVVDLVIVAAAGATAFTIFALPNHSTAQLRNVVGGHSICAVVGLACSYLPVIYVSGSLAVGFGMLLMVVINAEHPPAAGTALGLSVTPTLRGAIFIVLAAIVLSAIRSFLSPWMRDLT